jgi:hypothetical protein
MKLKLLFWLLLVGNVVLFGMSRGYFGANASERREPQRLAEQLRPELLSVLPANSEKLASQLRAQPATTQASAADCDGGRSARRGRPGGNPATACPACGCASRHGHPFLYRGRQLQPPMRAAFGPAGQPQAG